MQLKNYCEIADSVNELGVGQDTFWLEKAPFTESRLCLPKIPKG